MTSQQFPHSAAYARPRLSAGCPLFCRIAAGFRPSASPLALGHLSPHFTDCVYHVVTRWPPPTHLCITWYPRCGGDEEEGGVATRINSRWGVRAVWRAAHYESIHYTYIYVYVRLRVMWIQCIEPRNVVGRLVLLHGEPHITRPCKIPGYVFASCGFNV